MMRRVILQDRRHIYPFNEPARELRVQNKPLWLHQRDIVARHVTEEREYADWQQAHEHERGETVATILHRDNLYFNEALWEEFLRRALALTRPVRLAFRADDPTVATHLLPITGSLQPEGGLVLPELWYLPQGLGQLPEAEPLIIDSGARERGYYHVPPFMATDFGDLTYQLPEKALLPIESWAHLMVADVLFGLFARGVMEEERINAEWRYKLRIWLRSLLEQRSVLSGSRLVQLGRNCNVDATARILGPTTIGNNVTIGAGVVIDNCHIGDNVTISQGCQLMLSVVSDGCFLPFRASMFMSTMMENSMVAQNTCLQLCVVGRDSFIGAGTTFTDFNLLPMPLKAMVDGRLWETNFQVLGGCVGHHCRIGSGLVVYPGRAIESDVVLLASPQRRVLMSDVAYEESDHQAYQDRVTYPRLYPRLKEAPHGEAPAGEP